MVTNNDCYIRTYKQDDYPAVKHIAATCHDTDAVEGIDQPHIIFAQTAVDNETIIGTVFAWRSTFHSACVYFRIFITPSPLAHSVSHKLLETLMNFLKREQLDHLPLQTSLWETSVGLRDVYETYGLIEMRKTYEPILEVKRIQLPSFVKNNSYIKTVEDIATHDVLKEQLIQQIEKNYRLTHLDNPVSPTIGKDVWESLIFADDLIAAGSYVYVDEPTNEIVAYSLLHASEEKDTFELGWCGGKNKGDERFILTLIQHQIAYAQKSGIHNLLGEFDTTDEAAMLVLESFPFAPCPVWITYSLPVEKGLR